jgi:hypothetical protein
MLMRERGIKIRERIAIFFDSAGQAIQPTETIRLLRISQTCCFKDRRRTAAIHHRSLEAYVVSLLPSSRRNFPLQYNCGAVVVTMQEKRYSPRHQQSSRNSSLADVFFVVQASDSILSFWI